MLKRYHDTGTGATFDVIPAIDLRGGRVVRLAQGDFARETAYSDDPVEVATAFDRAGARLVHVVDLDGARRGQPVQRDTIAAIVAAVGERVSCQVAGGLRTPESAAAAVSTGAARIVIGTAALADPEFAAALVAAHGSDRVVVALDVRDGAAVGEAWRDGAPGVLVEDALDRLSAAGVTTFAVTAIDRDGLLEGPDTRLLERVVRLGPAGVVASGGIGSLVDIGRVRDIGCVGAIIGRAIYEGRIDLAEAVRRFGGG